jgi:hypothetical protein
MLLAASFFVFTTVTVSSMPTLWCNFITFFQIPALIENSVNPLLKTSKMLPLLFPRKTPDEIIHQCVYWFICGKYGKPLIVFSEKDNCYSKKGRT